MPLWTIYHPSTILSTQSEKDALATSITASYTLTIPAFYVVINFVSLPPTSIYRSGKPLTEQDRPFVRFVVHHLALQAKDHPEGLEKGFERGRSVVDRAIEEYVKGKGWSWEYSVLEEERRLWKIDGLMPPEFGSEAMELWRREDRAVPF